MGLVHIEASEASGSWQLELGVPVSGIAEAVFARSLSGHVDQRRRSRALPGPKDAPGIGAASQVIDDERLALDLGITGVPTMLMSWPAQPFAVPSMLSGAQPYALVRATIEGVLAA